MIGKQTGRGRRASALGLALLVSLAFGAIAASGAQALDWQHENHVALSGSESATVAGSGTSFAINGQVLGQSVEVDCSAASTSGSVAAEGAGTSTIDLSGCDVSQPSNCELASNPSLKASTELVEVGGNAVREVRSERRKQLRATAADGRRMLACRRGSALKGSFAGREVSGGMSVNRSLSFTKTKVWPEVALKLGKTAATMDGEATQHLSGSMENRGWRGIWQGGHGAWEVEQGYPFTSAESVAVSGGPLNSATASAAPRSRSAAAKWEPKEPPSSPAAPRAWNASPSRTAKSKPRRDARCRTTTNSNSPHLTGTLVQAGGNVYEKFTSSTGGAFAYLSLHRRMLDERNGIR